MPRVLFTRDTARDMQARSAAVQAAKRNGSQTPAPFPQLSAEQASYAREQLIIVREQIALVRKRLANPDLADKDAAPLMRALDTFLERERVLRMIPGPGQLRPQSPRSSSRQQSAPILPLGYADQEPPTSAPSNGE